jgi:NAD-dependent dihydropyrimidine dehydrogenase PreA subunit
MKIDEEKCIGCGNCVPYCPVSAISLNEKAEIDRERCVECGVCYRSGACPVDAIVIEELEYPRTLRSFFSDPLTVHKETGIPGRGTAEMKTNDVSNRFTETLLGLALEVGRPGISTSFEEVEKLTKRLVSLKRSGVPIEFEPDNPLTVLMNSETGELPEEIKKERVLSAIIEMRIPYEHVKRVLEEVKEVANEINTVFSLDFITRNIEGKRISEELLNIVQSAGFSPRPNGKTNVGLGRVGR